MKELHNHIFSTTPCISKETMLKFINKQLSDKEQHEIEKHILDCEFCTDALEGMRYARNSSVLFAIDNKIDQKTLSKNNNKKIYKNLMVAASLLIIAAGTFYTYDYFNSASHQQLNIAENVLEEKLNENVTPETTKSSHEQIFESQEKVEKMELPKQRGKSTNSIDNSPTPKASGFTQNEMMMNEERGEEMLVFDEVDKKDMAKNRLGQSLTDIEEIADEDASIEMDKITTDDNLSSKSSTATLEKKSDNKKKINPTRHKKSEAHSPTTSPEDIVLKDNNGIVVMSNHKVVDYTEKYQKEYDRKQVLSKVATTADFETKEQAQKAEREQEELTVEITYSTTLEQAMSDYNAQNYTLAIDQFNIILKEHPEDVNGLFYKGMSYYQLKNYQFAINSYDKVLKNEKKHFNEEARWYKALSFIELNQEEEAKKLLKYIVQNDTFYKKNAETLLLKIKNQTNDK